MKQETSPTLVTEPPAQPKRILILGGGFGGLYAALRLEKTLARDPDVQVTLVNRENFFLFTPMLHEVAASDLDLSNIVSPVRTLLKRVSFFQGDVEGIDLDRRTVTVSHGLDTHAHDMPYDALVLALGSITNFYGLPGLEERALTMKSLGDAVHLRNRLIALMEEADTECCALQRSPLMTFVVAGGGFAGVETIAGLHDFVLASLRFYPNIGERNVRFVLVHPGEHILPELGEELGRYAGDKLAARGIEIRGKSKVAAVDDNGVTLSDGTVIPSRTVIWTAGTTPNPKLGLLPCAKDRGRIKVDENLEVPGYPGVFAVGDCALIPNRKNGAFHPPTAQHALREGTVVAHNITAHLKEGRRRPFHFESLGQLAAIGRRTGVAKMFGLKFSGFFAWWLWRTIYLSKLPRFEKKLRVALDWTLDVFFSKDLVQFQTTRARTVSSAENTASSAEQPGARRTA
ncbi:MAG TPA: NAD(P)/FAD-dependent oxidoreductase [Candidatus Polarisedimenticolia bacterium]|nr:NAD(P)/FAD-dependent oxidoreductase [Candidatus Polarisedimenticolia bacterium]